MDVCANISEPITLKPLARFAVPTGLYVALPAGYELQVRPRSGLALRTGLTVVNSPGTIDADYRGEIRVPLINLSSEDTLIRPGERIAQIVLGRHEVVSWAAVDDVSALPTTERGSGGFGSTGL